MTRDIRRFQEVLQLIKRDILLENVKPRAKLLSERKLCEKHEVSRGTIREVLKALEATGLLDVKSGGRGGYFINKDASEISKRAVFSTTKLDKEFIIGSLIFRRMFEPSTSFYAAQNRTAKNLRELQQSIRTMEKGASDPKIYAESNFRFHYTIAKASGNPFIVGTYEYLFQMLIDASKMVYLIPTVVEVTKYFHREIYRSIKNGDGERAKMMMDTHLSTVPHYIQESKESSKLK